MTDLTEVKKRLLAGSKYLFCLSHLPPETFSCGAFSKSLYNLNFHDKKAFIFFTLNDWHWYSINWAVGCLYQEPLCTAGNVSVASEIFSLTKQKQKKLNVSLQRSESCAPNKIKADWGLTNNRSCYPFLYSDLNALRIPFSFCLSFVFVLLDPPHHHTLILAKI